MNISSEIRLTENNFSPLQYSIISRHSMLSLYFLALAVRRYSQTALCVFLKHKDHNHNISFTTHIQRECPNPFPLHISQ